MNNIIEIKDLRFSYTLERENDKGETETTVVDVLKGVDLNIAEGEFVAVLGHNGSGKSTLAKHLNAILVPESGSVTVLGIDTADEERVFEIRQNVGMVFQNPDNQLVATVVEEDVAFAPENLGIPPAEIRERVDYALKTVGMYEFINHAPHMLSGGQKQRVAIAGILAMKPKVIVLDEPTAMLDPSGRREIMQTIRTLNKEQKMTVVLITHYMDEAVQADRVVVINKGEIIIRGKPSEVFQEVEQIRGVGLDVPQATELIYRLNKKGGNFRKNVLTIDECVEEISNISFK